VTGIPVERGAILSGTSFGANLVAGKAIGKWNRDFCMPFNDVFERKEDMRAKYQKWKKLLNIAMNIKL
jgi:glycerol kinase